MEKFITKEYLENNLKVYNNTIVKPLVDSVVPKPTTADKVLLSALKDEKPVWTEVDKNEVSGTIQFIGTKKEWDSLTIEEKAKYDGKEVIFTDGETQLNSDKR